MSSTSLTPYQVNAVSWAFGATAIVLSAGRYIIRWRVIHRFSWDDLAHLTAVLFMVAELSIYDAFIGPDDVLQAWEKGKVTEQPEVLRSVEQMSVALHILFYLTIWSVKIAFLLFYRLLFNISKNFNIAWWIVLTYNIVTFWVCIAGALIQCGGDAKLLLNYNICESSAISKPWVLKGYIFTYVAVVTSDLATMILPLAMLRGLQIRRRQKISIAFLFSLSLVAIFFDTLRLARSFIGGSQLNILWYQIEETWVVIISALPSYYSLLNWSKLDSSRGSSSQYYTYGNSTRGKSTSSHPLSSRPNGLDRFGEGITKTYEVKFDVGNRV